MEGEGGWRGAELGRRATGGCVRLHMLLATGEACRGWWGRFEA